MTEPATYGEYATITIDWCHDPILVKVGSVDQDCTVLHLLGPLPATPDLHRMLRVNCTNGQLSDRWHYTPLGGTLL